MSKSSEIKILTYNVHLWGVAANIFTEPMDEIVYFEDEDRAELIGKKLRDSDADVICLQEAWSPILLNSIEKQLDNDYPTKLVSGFGLLEYLDALSMSAVLNGIDWTDVNSIKDHLKDVRWKDFEGIIEHLGDILEQNPFKGKGKSKLEKAAKRLKTAMALINDGDFDRRKWKQNIELLGGGVAIFLRDNLEAKDTYWKSYKTSAGDDVLSDKGFLKTRVKYLEDPTFNFGVIATHMQSKSEYWCDVKQSQVEQVAGALESFTGKNHHPKNPVILAGDFNIQAEYNEHDQEEGEPQNTCPGDKKAETPVAGSKTPHYEWIEDEFTDLALVDTFREKQTFTENKGFTANNATNKLMCHFDPEPDDSNDEKTDQKRLDYIFSGNSGNGQNKVHVISSTLITDWQYMAKSCTSDDDVKTDLSDHYPIETVVQFEFNG